MIRKDALREAVKIVENAQIDEQKKEEIIAGLKLCLSELPFSHWSKEAIFDACDEWVQMHGKMRTSAFVSAEMPTHVAIKRRFGMTAKEFRDKYYPLPGIKKRSQYSDHPTSYWDEVFIEEFNRLRITGQDDYNRRRDKSHPTWCTLARMHNTEKWSELLNILGLTSYYMKNKHPELNIKLIEDPIAELLK